MSSQEKIYITPTPVRIWHWLNALGIVTLSITGIQIRYPDHVAIFESYRAAIRLHNTAGIVVALSYVLWFVYYMFIAKNMVKLYIPTADDIKRGVFRQAIYYGYQYFVGQENPHMVTPTSKFNPMQKCVYLVIMFLLLPLVSITGIMLLNVSIITGLTLMIGTMKILVGTHFLLACAFTGFLFVHIYLATLGSTLVAHFKSMWTGWEEHGPHGTEKRTEDDPDQ